MKAKIPFMILISLAAAVISSVSVANAEDEKDIYISEKEHERIAVQWIEPKSFTDVRETNFSSSKFRKQVFHQLEKHLDKLAKDLPDGQKLSFEVTDLDLAGRIEPAGMLGLWNNVDDVRVMRDVDIPRIEFTYNLLDSEGNVIKTDNVELKDMNYLMHSAYLRNRNRPYAYEKRMLTDWFKKSILSEQA